MSKITVQHLNASLASMSVNRPQISSCTTSRASAGNTALPIAPGILAGRLSKSSKTISDDRAEASPVRASNGCWPRSATVVSAPCSRSRLRVRTTRTLDVSHITDMAELEALERALQKTIAGLDAE